MYLENIVFDAVDPQKVAGFWESELHTERFTDVPEGVETRLSVPDGPVLDLCFQRVPEPPTGPQRLRLEVGGVVDGPLTDPEGAAFERVEGIDDTGPLAAMALEVGDPDRDLAFWAWLTGWEPVEGAALRHPSGRGPLVELRPEAAPKGAGKNRIHLDARLESGDDADAVAREIAERGGRELHPDWGDLPWRVYQDPSGNEFCVLRAYAPPPTLRAPDET